MPEINQITDLNGTTYDIRDNSKVNSNQGAANAGKALGIDSTGAVVPVPFSGEDFTGATSSTDGTHGYVPAPEAGMQQYFLKADGTWDAPPGTKLIEKTLDTVTNTSGSYTHTTTLSDVTADMKAVMIELSNPSAFLSDITITPADGSITLSCSSVAGTSTVKVGLLFVAGASAITSSEFDVLAGRIGTLGDLQTIAKTSLVAATNENTQAITNTNDKIKYINAGIGALSTIESALATIGSNMPNLGSQNVSFTVTSGNGNIFVASTYYGTLRRDSSGRYNLTAQAMNDSSSDIEGHYSSGSWAWNSTKQAIANLADGVYGAEGKVTLSFYNGTYTDGIYSQNIRYKVCGALVIVNGSFKMSENASSSAIYAAFTGLPYNSKWSDIIGHLRCSNDALLLGGVKISAISGRNSALTFYFNKQNGAYALKDQVIEFTIIYPKE